MILNKFAYCFIKIFTIKNFYSFFFYVIMYIKDRLVVTKVKKAKNVLKFSASAFLVMLVLLCVYTFVVTDILKKDYVNVFGYSYFVVATGSMSGTIEVDDIIFVKITKDVKINDIVTFKNKDGDIITHRLIKYDGSRYITKGDINNVSDEAVSKEQIIGKVSLVISPSFILKCIAIFLIIFIFLALVNFDSIIKKIIVSDDNNKESNIKKDNHSSLDDSNSALSKSEKMKIINNEKVVTKDLAPKNVGASSFLNNNSDNIELLEDTVVSTPIVNRLPDDIFKNPKRRVEEPSSGLTVTISIDEMEELDKIHSREVLQKEREELVENYDDYQFSYTPMKKKNKNLREKETIDFVVSILKCKNNSIAKARMNKKWLERYRYVYKLCFLLLTRSTELLNDEIERPPFKEIYDYDLDKVGLTQSIRNRVYDMPIYVFLRILTYSILYNDDEMFDGIYKILKYKAMIDPNKEFTQLSRSDKEAFKQVNTLISFMRKVSNKFDNKHVFELEKIERIVQIGKY